jgi:hypothetical protein
VTHEDGIRKGRGICTIAQSVHAWDKTGGLSFFSSPLDFGVWTTNNALSLHRVVTVGCHRALIVEKTQDRSKQLCTMSDEEQDFHIESADAGASAVIPCDAGAIKKGGYVVIRGFVCWHCVIICIDFE